jgi:dephospho-CoA kinase
MTVIGLVGPIASGKGVVADLLRERGFFYLSLSDRVREEAKRRGVPEERETLQNIGNELRLREGNDVLARRTADIIGTVSSSNVVIDGIRNPAEIEYLRERFEARIIGVIASADVRFQLMQRRKRPSDPETREVFDRLEQRDRGVGEEDHGQQVEACLNLADVTVENPGLGEGGLENLRKNAEEAFHYVGIDARPGTIERRYA